MGDYIKEHAILSCDGLEPVNCGKLDLILQEANNCVDKVNLLCGDYLDDTFTDLNDKISDVLPIYTKIYEGYDISSKDMMIINNAKRVLSDKVLLYDISHFNHETIKAYYNLKNLLEYIDSHPVLNHVYKIRIQQNIYDRSMKINGIQLYKNKDEKIDLQTCEIDTNDLTLNLKDIKAKLVKNDATNKFDSLTISTQNKKNIFFDILIASNKCIDESFMMNSQVYLMKIHFYDDYTHAQNFYNMSGINIFVLDCKEIVLASFPIVPVMIEDGTYAVNYDVRLFNNRQILNININDYTFVMGTEKYVITRHIIIQRKDTYTGGNNISFDKITIYNGETVLVPTQILAYPVNITDSGEVMYGKYAMVDQTGLGYYLDKYASTSFEDSDVNYFHIDLGENKKVTKIKLQKANVPSSNLSSLIIRTITDSFILTSTTTTDIVTQSVINIALTGNEIITIFNPYMVEFDYPSSLPHCIQDSNNQTYVGYKYNYNNMCFLNKIECNIPDCLSAEYVDYHMSCDDRVQTNVNNIRYVVIHQPYYIPNDLSIYTIQFYERVGLLINNNNVIGSMIYPTSNRFFASDALVTGNTNPVTVSGGFVKKYIKYDFGEDIKLIGIKIKFNRTIPLSNDIYVAFIKDDNTVVSNKKIIVAMDFVTVYVDNNYDDDMFAFNTIEYSTLPLTVKNVETIKGSKSIKKLEFVYPDCKTYTGDGKYCLDKRGKHLNNVIYRIKDNSQACYIPKNSCNDCLSNVNLAISNDQLQLCDINDNYPLCMYARLEIPPGTAGAVSISKLSYYDINDATTEKYFDYYVTYPLDSVNNRDEPDASIAPGREGNLLINMTSNTNNNINATRFIQGILDFTEKRIYRINLNFGSEFTGNVGIFYIINKFGTATYKNVINLETDTINRTITMYPIVNTSITVDPSYRVKLINEQLGGTIDPRYYKNNIAMPGGKYMFRNHQICFTPNAKCQNCLTPTIRGVINPDENLQYFNSCSSYIDTRFSDPYTCYRIRPEDSCLQGESAKYFYNDDMGNRAELAKCESVRDAAISSRDEKQRNWDGCERSLGSWGNDARAAMTGLNNCLLSMTGAAADCSNRITGISTDLTSCKTNLNTCNDNLSKKGQETDKWRSLLFDKSFTVPHDLDGTTPGYMLDQPYRHIYQNIVPVEDGTNFSIIHIKTLTAMIADFDYTTVSYEATTGWTYGVPARAACKTPSRTFFVYKDNIKSVSTKTYTNDLQSFLAFNKYAYKGYRFKKIEIGAWHYTSPKTYDFFHGEAKCTYTKDDQQHSYGMADTVYIDNIYLMGSDGESINLADVTGSTSGAPTTNMTISIVVQSFYQERTYAPTEDPINGDMGTPKSDGLFSAIRFVDSNICEILLNKRSSLHIFISKYNPSNDVIPHNRRTYNKYWTAEINTVLDPIPRGEMYFRGDVIYNDFYSLPLSNLGRPMLDKFYVLTNDGESKQNITLNKYNECEPYKYFNTLLRIQPSDQNQRIAGMFFRLRPGPNAAKNELPCYGHAQIFIKCYPTECPDSHVAYVCKCASIYDPDNPDGSKGRYYAVMFN